MGYNPHFRILSHGQATLARESYEENSYSIQSRAQFGIAVEFKPFVSECLL